MPNNRKSTHLHAVEGTYNSTRHADRDGEPEAKGGLIKPIFLSEDDKHLKSASKLWDEYADRMWWLGDADSHHLAAYVSLLAEFEADPKHMQAARYGQMRSYGGELGVGSNRSKFNTNSQEQKDDLLD